MAGTIKSWVWENGNVFSNIVKRETVMDGIYKAIFFISAIHNKFGEQISK